MALLYETRRGGAHYRVTSAGRSRRLYKNGIFHTQYNPHNLFTGSVWDMLSVPAVFASTQPGSVLMLGVGGGGAIHQLERLFAPSSIVGIDLDDVHLRLARRFFDLDYPGLQLLHADAIDWISQNSRRRFDLVVDDIFIESENPVRPIDIDADWLKRVSRLVSTRGVLIQNHATRAGALATLREHRDQLRAAFTSVLMFEPERCGNVILAGYRQTATARDRARVERWLQQKVGADARRLDYSVRQV